MNRREFLAGAALTIAAISSGRPAFAQQGGAIRVGVLYDLSGPFAGAGAMENYRGTKIAIDMINEAGGILGKYKIDPIYVDTQSKADVVLNEAERLLAMDDVSLIMGLFSSAHAVPLAAKVEPLEKILFITNAISPAIVKDRHLKYTFKNSVNGALQGAESIKMLAGLSQQKLGIAPKDLKLAIIHEDGSYGTTMADGNRSEAAVHGMQIVIDEAYSANTSDFSALVTKMRREKPDAILHTGYGADVTLFLRQARERGLRTKVLVGQGAGYGNYPVLREAMGDSINYVLNIDSAAAQLLPPEKLQPEVRDLAKEFLRRYAETIGHDNPPLTASLGFNGAWVLFHEIIARALEAKGGVYDTEAVRQAALALDIPTGGTIQGTGVKFEHPESDMAGQNVRAAPVVTQYVDGKINIVWPLELAAADVVMPLPADSPYAEK
ncbi:ABC transporter substrate-binding protein [Rhizobium sp. LjRoot30]|uniref:ABC transporter substrate-binding protein n=1 Tax=Rhizobium sp. LjRoot30 TaxID=3342320 RepID=UPI003ECD2CAC